VSGVLVGLRPHVALRTRSDRTPALLAGDREFPLKSFGAGAATVLTRLGLGPLAPEEVENDVLETDGMEGLASWYSAALKLCTVGLLEYSVREADRVVATSIPGRQPELSFHAVEGTARLSRFAHIRRDGEEVVLASPIARARVVLSDPMALAAVVALFQSRSPAELCELAGGDADRWIPPFLSLLQNAGLLIAVRDDGRTAEDDDPTLRSWEFHDLVFHTRSTHTNPCVPFGPTFRFEDVLDPVPALKPAMSDVRITLPRPQVNELIETDPPLVQVMEQRRSIRSHGSDPIDLGQLGEFLFRVAHLREPAGAEGARFPVRRRVYPGGGACHPLEIYPVVGRCTGVEEGLYRYDPEGHQLEQLPGASDEAKLLLRDGSTTMDGGTEPQIWLILTARFGRTAWKYEGVAYALVLQEVGVLYEAMYLAATAMGLAPCARGFLDGRRFTRAVGIDPLAEAPVGGFILGSRA
jgi:SagB-type dehydrogenase family enzyme